MTAVAESARRAGDRTLLRQTAGTTAETAGEDFLHALVRTVAEEEVKRAIAVVCILFQAAASG